MNWPEFLLLFALDLLSFLIKGTLMLFGIYLLASAFMKLVDRLMDDELDDDDDDDDKPSRRRWQFWRRQPVAAKTAVRGPDDDPAFLQALADAMPLIARQASQTVSAPTEGGPSMTDGTPDEPAACPQTVADQLQAAATALWNRPADPKAPWAASLRLLPQLMQIAATSVRAGGYHLTATTRDIELAAMVPLVVRARFVESPNPGRVIVVEPCFAPGGHVLALWLYPSSEDRPVPAATTGPGLPAVVGLDLKAPDVPDATHATLVHYPGLGWTDLYHWRDPVAGRPAVTGYDTLMSREPRDDQPQAQAVVSPTAEGLAAQRREFLGGQADAQVTLATWLASLLQYWTDSAD